MLRPDGSIVAVKLLVLRWLIALAGVVVVLLLLLMLPSAAGGRVPSAAAAPGPWPLPWPLLVRCGCC
jgi:hypothetical protein